MGYVSRHGRRPNEYASRSAHSHVIKDPLVQAFLTKCNLPKRAGDIGLPEKQCVACQFLPDNPIRHIIAIDGGYNEVAVQTEFPSSTVCFFQIGALIFSIEDLEGIEEQPFIDPDDMARLKQIQRLKFTLPVRNVTMREERTLTESVRRALYGFFRQRMDNGELIDSLKWFVFKEYSTPESQWTLASCPACEQTEVPLYRSKMTKDYTFSCEHCGHEILLTDVFRLHEAIDDELGAGGILGYVTTTIEQIIIVHLIRLILDVKPALLKQILFIKDGPLAFFGQTANMHKPMRSLVRFLFEHHDLYLAGLEKSGPFVEHADEISEKIGNGTVFILDNDYIYKYVLPGKADPNNPYGRTTYYGNKLIFKTSMGSMYVTSLPTQDIISSPTEKDFHNLHQILMNIEKLKCDMYDNSLFPIALANKLVSLANHPSSVILQRFAVGAIPH
jgi:hypothetical protein